MEAIRDENKQDNAQINRQETVQTVHSVSYTHLDVYKRQD